VLVGAAAALGIDGAFAALVRGEEDEMLLLDAAVTQAAQAREMLDERLAIRTALRVGQMLFGGEV
jgi:hypothetical protein